MSNVDPHLGCPSPGAGRRAKAAKKADETGRRRPGLIQRMFAWLAAVDSRVYAFRDCSADWRRYAILGAAVLVTGILAAFYGTVVVYSYYTQNAKVAALCGIAWGSIIVVCDRLMLASLVKAPDTGSGALALMAAPRVLLALLIACAVSVPAELVLFGRQIDKQLQIQHQEEVGAQQRRLNEEYAEITKLDSIEGALQTELASKDAAVAKQFEQAACEADGTCGSGESGDGFRYQEKLARYLVLKGEADRTREAHKAQLKVLRARRDSLEREKSQALTKFRVVADDADDLLSRMTALELLQQDPKLGRSVWIASWVIRLLVALIEILPLGTKLLSRRGPYEAAYLAVHDGQRARWDGRREAAIHRATVERDRRGAIANSVRETTLQMVQQATTEALTSRGARRAMRDLQRQILDESVRVARRAAAKVFARDALEREITEAARARRRRAGERIVESEAYKADVENDLDRAAADAEEVLGQEQNFTETEWPRPERQGADAGMVG